MTFINCSDKFDLINALEQHAYVVDTYDEPIEGHKCDVDKLLKIVGANKNTQGVYNNLRRLNIIEEDYDEYNNEYEYISRDNVILFMMCFMGNVEADSFIKAWI